MDSRRTKSSKKSSAHAALTLDIPPPPHLWFRGPWPIATTKACRLTGRSARTLTRHAAAGWPDLAVLTCLQAVVYGVLPHPDWKEWHLSPDGFLAYWRPTRGVGSVLPSDLLQRDVMAKELATQRGTIRRLQAELDALKAAGPAPVEPQQLHLVFRRA